MYTTPSHLVGDSTMGRERVAVTGGTRMAAMWQWKGSGRQASKLRALTTTAIRTQCKNAYSAEVKCIDLTGQTVRNPHESVLFHAFSEDIGQN